MATKRDKKDVDAEIDLHGLNVEQMRHALQKKWPEWRGMRRVRIVHGRGEALGPEVERWSREMGIPYRLEAANPGSSLIFPVHRVLPEASLTTSLREKGLRLTPEQEAILRDPERLKREQQEALRKKREEEEKRQAEAIKLAAQRRRDEVLWKAEMARLDAQDRNRSRKQEAGEKPAAPHIAPPSEIKHQEGWWRAELVRVADTDTDTLKKEKRTGLEKLAPPLDPKPATSPQSGPRKPSAPTRDTAADQALFEAEMARLSDTAPSEVRRSKRD